MSGWRDKAEALEGIYNDLDFCALRSDVVKAIGEDQAEEIMCRIDDIYSEMMNTIIRLFVMAGLEDARAADGEEGR